MANRTFVQFLNTFHHKPVILDCNFVVDSTNGNGLGQRNLKGQGVRQVYMHTSATPATGNPNPAAGYILVNLSDNYNRYLTGFSGLVAPTTGSTITISTGSALTLHNPYIITSLGTSTLADWQAVGLPLGLTPAVGASFIATATSAGSGSGTVMAPGVSGITNLEVVGDPNQTLAPIGNGIKGSWILVQCEGLPSSGTSPLVKNPADGSVVSLSFYLNDSSVLIKGE